jgi:hypothetical protein
MADPEKARKRAREEFAQINIRIRAQEALVKKLSKKINDVVAWHDADRQLKTLKKKRQEIIKRMGS